MEISLKNHYRWASWSSKQLIGDIFVNLGESLKVYSQYFNSYEKSLSSLQVIPTPEIPIS